jgi:hypothetical protein
MKHVEWLKARSLHCALGGKTPYEMKCKKKPHLGGIHKFCGAAYVKDLKARKPDSHTQLGWFIGYDLESKGYRIYWPNKQSVTVDRNVVFNDSDMTMDTATIIPSDLSKGEKEKVVKVPKMNINHTEEDATANNLTPENNDSNSAPDAKKHNTIPFPVPPEASDAIPCNPIEEPDIEPNLAVANKNRRRQKHMIGYLGDYH